MIEENNNALVNHPSHIYPSLHLLEGISSCNRDDDEEIESVLAIHIGSCGAVVYLGHVVSIILKMSKAMGTKVFFNSPWDLLSSPTRTIDGGVVILKALIGLITRETGYGRRCEYMALYCQPKLLTMRDSVGKENHNV